MMFWVTLGLYIGSFILSRVLAPKPNIERERPKTIHDLNFPTASEGRPVAVLFGRARMHAPNVLWFGGFRSGEITEKEDVFLGKDRTNLLGYAYFIGLDLGLCLGPNVKLFGVYIDNKYGVYYTSTPIGTSYSHDIGISARGSLPYYDSTGECLGVNEFNFWGGEFDQNYDQDLAAYLGTSSIPTYTGVAHIMFVDCYLGQNPQLPQLSFEIQRMPNNLGLLDSVRLIGDDLNPMEILYSIMTEEWGGCGLDANNFDIPSFQDAAEVLANEGNGMSLLIENVNKAESIVQEILRQVDGILYQEPTTGKITMKLIRADYDPETLPLLTVSTVSAVENFTCTSWAETFNQVRVTFSSRIKRYEEASVLAQDLSNINMQGGKIRTATVSFPGVHTSILATKIASRELTYLNVPLYRASVHADRSAGLLRPGSPFKLTWPEYGLDEVVMRAQQFNFNELLNGRIVIEVVQDKFAAAAYYADLDGTGWLPTTRDPEAITVYKVFESSYWFISRINNLEEPATSAWFWYFAWPASIKQQFYSAFYSRDNFVDESAVALNRVPYAARGTLKDDLWAMMGMRYGILDELTVSNPYPPLTTRFFTRNTTDKIKEYGRGVFIIDDELMSYEDFTENLDGSVTLTNIHRALLDTKPANHAAGALMFFFFNVSSNFASGITWLGLNPLDDDTQLWYRLASGTDEGEENPTTVATHTITPDKRYTRPLPPDLTFIEGAQIVTSVITLDTTLSLEWLQRNRLTQVQIAFHNDTTDAPETSTTWEFDLYVNEIAVATRTGVTGTSISDFTITHGKGLARMEAWGRRSGLRSFTPDVVEFFLAYYPNSTANLLTNGDFETAGLASWTVVSGVWARTSTVYPLNVIRTVAVGAYHAQPTSAPAEISQVVDITTPTDYRGKASVIRVLKGGGVAGAQTQMIAELLNSSDVVLDSVTTPLMAPQAIGKWELLEVPMPILSTAAKLKIRLKASSTGGIFDNANIRVNTVSTTSAAAYDSLTGITVKGAWGLRKLVSTYSGALVRVRDTYDDTETDLYPDADGNLEAFFTVGQARVVKLYDQSGNGADLTPESVSEQPLLQVHVSFTGRPAIEFDLTTCSLMDATTGTTRPYMVTRPNCCMVFGPKWGVASTAFIAGVFHQASSSVSPYYRYGLRTVTSSANWTYHYNTTQVVTAGAGSYLTLRNVWWLDYYNGAVYHNEDVTPKSTFTPEDITYPNATRLALGENASETQDWGGYFYELCVFEGNISAADRKTMMESLGLYWHNLTV